MEVRPAANNRKDRIWQVMDWQTTSDLQHWIYYVQRDCAELERRWPTRSGYPGASTWLRTGSDGNVFLLFIWADDFCHHLCWRKQATNELKKLQKDVDKRYRTVFHAGSANDSICRKTDKTVGKTGSKGCAGSCHLEERRCIASWFERHAV